MGDWLELGPAGNRAYLAVPERGSGAGVLVLHAWWGLTPDVTDVCDRLAAEGYVALAPSLYANGATASTIPEAEALRDAHDNSADKVEAIALNAVDELRRLPAVADGPIATIGFSLGASWALHLSQARPDDVGAAVTVYGTGGGDFSTARAAYLGHFAEQDDFEPLEFVHELETAIREAGREVTFHIYPNTGHWFAEPGRPDAYNAEAAELVWDRTLAFLNAHLG